MYTVFSKPACPFCDRAKALLESKGLPFSVVHLDVGQQKIEGETYISRDELLDLIPTARTMPQIQVATEDGMETIGGYTELAARLA